MLLGFAKALLLAAVIPGSFCLAIPSVPLYPRSINVKSPGFTVSVLALKAAGFKGDILVPGDAQFGNATLAWSLNYNKNPTVALRPTTADDVVIAIRWLNTNNFSFAVRSGGAAASQSDIILDLAKFNKVEYNSADSTVRLGPGQKWGDVYPAMANLPVTVLGGRVGFVGVGGFTLGGGMSYLQNQYGLASDSIVDAQVVTAEGCIKWASKDADLMFAIRGAGYTIGVVTELVVKAYPKPKQIFSGFLLFTPDKYATIRDNVAKFTASNTDPNLSLLIGIVSPPPANQQLILVFPIVYGDAALAKKTFPWAYSLGAVQDTTGPVTWEVLQTLQLAFVHHPEPTSNYQQHSVVTSSMSAAVLQAGADWQTALAKDPRFAGASLLFEPFIPGSFSSHDKKGAWPHSSKSLHVIQLFIEQLNAKAGDDVVNAQKLREGAALIEKAAGASTLQPRYTDYVLQGTPADQFYGANLAKLKTIKKKFDPKNRFNTNIAIV